MITKIYYNDKDNKVALVEETGIAPIRYKLLKPGKWYIINEINGLYGVYNMHLLGYTLIGVFYESEFDNLYL